MGAIVPGLASIFGIFLIRQFAASIPDSLIEAARMDGASDFKVYRSIILPLCRPILFTLALFTFMGTWNDFMWPLIIMTDNANYTLPVAIANLKGEHLSPQDGDHVGIIDADRKRHHQGRSRATYGNQLRE